MEKNSNKFINDMIANVDILFLPAVVVIVWNSRPPAVITTTEPISKVHSLSSANFS